MLEWILELDEALFLFLNELNTTWLDPIMFFISGKLEWIWLYVLIIVRLIYKHKKAGLIALVVLILSVSLNDYITSGLMKPYFERIRPSHDPSLAGMVHILNNYKGGLYSFASSHASNAFALATFLWLIFRRKEKWVVYMFVWAAVVAYSRIYLGVHYPGDIIVGASVGAIVANILYRLYNILAQRFLWPSIQFHREETVEATQ